MGSEEYQVNSYLGRQSAWHSVGTVKGDYINRKEINEHGLTFKADKRQLEFSGEKVPAWAVYNTDLNQFIAPCSEDYAIHPPAVVFDTMDEILDAAGDGCKYEVAGALGGFKVVWGLADIKATIRIGDDEIKQFLFGITSFDSSMSTQFGQTNVRMVCENTIKQALSQKAASALKIRHTSKSHRRLQDAREALSMIKSDFMKTGERLQFLANRYVNPVDMNNLLEAVIAAPVGKPDTERESKRHQNILNTIIDLYESNDRDAFPEQRGTVYNMLNAFTNYVDHERSTRTRDGENETLQRAKSSLFGQGNQIKDKALTVLTQYADKATYKPSRTFGVAVPEMPSLLDDIINQSN